MNIRLTLTGHFRQLLKADEFAFDIPDGSTVGDLVSKLLDTHPEHRQTLEQHKCFLFDELRAVYMVGGLAVKTPHVLHDGEELVMLHAHIGG